MNSYRIFAIYYQLKDMATNKKDLFNHKEKLLADFANAISHPARVAILKEIAKQESCICGEIVSVLPLAQSTVSQHLKELLKAGLITGSVDGAKSCYCINWKTFELFEKQFSEFFAKTNTNNPKCC